MLMNKQDIEKYLELVGQELATQGLAFELLLLGGAVMVIEVGNRESTQDIDTFFWPDFAAMAKAAAVVARREGLPDGWLNTAAAGFTYNFQKLPVKKLWKKFPGLEVYTASLEYILVSKLMASRLKNHEDIKALATQLQISKQKDMLTLVREYVSVEDISEDVLDEIADLFEP